MNNNLYKEIQEFKIEILNEKNESFKKIKTKSLNKRIKEYNKITKKTRKIYLDLLYDSDIEKDIIRYKEILNNFKTI